ncbi:MBL fold metallo-hydrolase [Actinosynnema sp. ALI-1.44]|nr:MBL fold metallo-hydrolase [Actinosynnema sp. ALI-1.44]
MIGGWQIVALRDARGPFLDWAAGFPDAGEREWASARAADPAAFGADGKWWLDFRAYAIRAADGRVTLVDAGIGPATAPARAWAPVPGRLPEAMAEAGIDPADVGTVVLTHLHTDHCGWAVDPDGTPVFPNARYVVQHAETKWLAAAEPMYSWAVRPLRDAGQLDEITGESVVLRTSSGESVTLVPTPGHTPGHQSVIVQSGDAQLIVTGDVLVHAVQLVAPSVSYVYEEDQRQARDTRTNLLARARDAGAVLATPHLSEPFTVL